MSIKKMFLAKLTKTQTIFWLSIISICTSGLLAYIGNIASNVNFVGFTMWCVMGSALFGIGGFLGVLIFFDKEI